MTEAPCYPVPLEHYPGMSRFVLDWLQGDERFLSRQRNDRPPGKPRRISPTLIEALAASNRKWGLLVNDELARWASGETLTVIAGQQVGFAGGPMYTAAKLASLLKMKRDNEARGVATTVFFWLATEDHDFDEVANIALPRKGEPGQTDLAILRARRTTESKQVVGQQPIPESLVSDFLRTTNATRPPWLRPGMTFADSFAELLATAFDGKFILIDSLLPELRRAGAPLVETIMRRWHDVQHEIAERSEMLQQAGYTPPVLPRPGDPYTLLFRIDDDGNRELLAPSDFAGVAPDRISTSALTRPLLQDFVIQPDVFVGGPAEVGYFAQIATLHGMLGIPLPRVALRGHVLVAPRRVVRHFARHAINPEDVFTSPDKLLASHEPRGVGEIRATAAEAERQLEEHIEKIRDLALPAAHAVARSINRSIGHISYHFRKLTERAIRGLVRKDKERYDAARELVSTFFPDGHVQDRIVAWVPFWLDSGKAFTERVISEVEPDARIFKIVSL